MRPDGPRDELAGPTSGPEPPFPIKLSGPVIRGFGRGGKELGIPTANIPPSGLSAYPDLQSGIYFGYTSLHPAPSSAPSHSGSTSSHSNSTGDKPSTPASTSDSHSNTNSIQIYPCVLSLGYNPFYKNTTRSIEIHILHTFSSDFYTHNLNLLILGFIRPEYDYVNLDSLIEDINFDCGVARRSLQRSGWGLDSENAITGGWKEYLNNFTWAAKLTGEDVRKVEKEVLGGSEKVGSL